MKARSIAAAVLQQVTDEGAYANIALRAAFLASDLSKRDRAFVTEIVNESVRNLIYIDHVADAHARTKIADMQPLVRAVVRTALCQILVLSRVPSRAAIHEAVEIIKQARMGKLAGFVNGVLRSIIRNKKWKNPPEGNPALRYSYPPWLYGKLQAALGDGLPSFLAHSHTPPQLTILTNTLRTTREKLAVELEAEGIASAPVSAGMLALTAPGDLTRLPQWRDGHFLVLDPGAMHAVQALNMRPGEILLDLCAAPGGKSFAAAIAMENRGQIHSLDIHPHKIDLLRDGAARLGLGIICPAISDALVPNPALPLADAVLLDAPCSGFGTLRRHPEIKYNRRPADIPALAATQLQMLTAAAAYVKPGGRLIYCTCTITPEENQDIITKFSIQSPHFSIQNSQLHLTTPHSSAFFTATLTSKTDMV
jgi:16S rRNA (cytosine967-C5)-methyltransferase